ncbi:hypothetical protein GCK72_014082 [Caenorhabditis remanei]|uniref:BZIP domain-containing protein n=1 Tax=Caenorhabditis remanei TaxID=31234 RepID=A0A6A5GSS9_CAERE|nr:hypothetical protein GCK72_014082 [Caenorhabditis remanei]KAF1757626.1 hypothetical protein GCK72_014082 [Caenorhabditis remanei]
MRSNTPTQPVNRLRHFPYKNENMYFENSKMDEKYRTMTQHNPFSTHGQPSNHPSEYLPESFFGYENHTSPFHQEPNTSLQMYPTPTDDMGNDWIKREEDREDEEEDETLPVIGRGKSALKPARKYMKKSEKERNDPIYRDARDRNNAAVRKTRQKAKKQQEEEKKKFEELKKEYQLMKKKNEEMEKKMCKATAAINLIQNFKREFHNHPFRISSDIFPSLTEMLNFA